MRWLAYWAMRLFGWRVEGSIPPIRKFVVLGAPHTSNWDFVLFLGTIHYLGIRPKVLGKHTLVRWPFGGLMRRWGVIPVRRDVHENTVARVRDAFEENDEMMLVIAPEGTRSRAEHWKSGFYKIAHSTEVPVVLAAVDGPGKTVKVSDPIELTGDVATDMDRIREFYEGYQGLRPDLRTPVRLREELPS